jgi:hypothetical protein
VDASSFQAIGKEAEAVEFSFAELRPAWRFFMCRFG